MSEWAKTAKWLMAGGIKPIPSYPDLKRPRINWTEWQKSWPTDEQLEEWGKRYPDSEWCSPTGADSGYVVVDIDSVDLLEPAAKMGLCYSDVVVRTTRGFHYYYRHPGEDKIKNHVGSNIKKADRTWPSVTGLDFKADGGQVRVPPSGELEWVYGLDLEDMPTWKGYEYEPSHQQWFDVSDPTELAQRSLAVTKFEDLHARDVQATGEDAFMELVQRGGGKVREGGRNKAFFSLCAWAVSQHSAMPLSETLGYCQTMADNYIEGLDQEELETTYASALDIERNHHPERFLPQPHEVVQVASFEGITLDNIDDYEAALPDPPVPIVENMFQRGAATLINGYSGSGKSQFVLGALMAACDPDNLNKFVGPMFIRETPKVLYLDPENSESIIISRMRQLSNIGKSGDRLTVLPGRMLTDDGFVDTGFNLNQPEALDGLCHMVREGSYTCVVIDTVRSHWPGMEESKAEAWTDYNHAIMRLKRMGCAVVLLHHTNKAREDGYQSESGSAHQLTNIDTQIFVQPVVKDDIMARRMGGVNMLDERNYVSSLSPTGYSSCEIEVLINSEGGVSSHEVIRYMSKISFGKVRDRTEQHQHPIYMAQALYPEDDAIRLVGSYTLRKIIHGEYVKRRGTSANPFADIARELQVPLSEVRAILKAVGV
jgi:hypothetical protein